MGLKLFERIPESGEVTLYDRREDSQQDDAAEPFGHPLADRGKLGERPNLVRAVQAVTSPRLDDEHRPLVGERTARDQGRDVAVGLSAPIHDEAALSKPMQADPRAMATTGQAREILGCG
jgi:hypothetical protein